MALSIIVNGQERILESLNPGDALASVVDALDLKGDRIAVERNGQIASRPDWGTIQIASQDRLEVVHFVGGGDSE